MQYPYLLWIGTVNLAIRWPFGWMSDILLSEGLTSTSAAWWVPEQAYTKRSTPSFK